MAHTCPEISLLVYWSIAVHLGLPHVCTQHLRRQGCPSHNMCFLHQTPINQQYLYTTFQQEVHKAVYRGKKLTLNGALFRKGSTIFIQKCSIGHSKMWDCHEISKTCWVNCNRCKSYNPCFLLLSLPPTKNELICMEVVQRDVFLLVSEQMSGRLFLAGPTLSSGPVLTVACWRDGCSAKHFWSESRIHLEVNYGGCSGINN